MKKITLKEIITCLITIAFGIASGLGIGINIKTNGDGTIEIETKLGIELSEKQIPATIEIKTGETIIDNDIVTVEEVNTNTTNECKDGEECGRGEYIYAPTLKH